MREVRADAAPGAAAKGGSLPVVLTVTVLAVALATGWWLAGFGRLLDPTGFVPRWTCGDWDAPLGWLHVVADIATFAAYVSIPIVLWWFVRRRKDVPLSGLFVLFGMFILACGLVHLIEAVLFWQPVYRLSGVAKLVTAVVSWATVVALVRTMPKALRLPSIVREVEERRQAEVHLAQANEKLLESRGSAVQLATQSEELRRLSERYLQESRAAEAMSQLVIESSPNAQVMIDTDGRIVLFNKTAERIFGYPREEMLGKPVELLVPEALRAEHVARREAFQREPSARDMGSGRELFGLRKDGSEVPIEIGLNPVHSGDTRYVLAGIIDITARRRSEGELRRYADALRASNTELEQFAQFASHDLQEPLRKLISFSTLLVEDLPGEMPEAARKDLEYITDAALRMRSLVRGLLDLTKSGRRELRLERVALNDCVVDALEALSERTRETDAKVEVEQLPTIRGDRLLLTQLFQNLIGNALKFQPPSVSPEVSVTCTQDGDAWEVVVRDNGIGIKPEYAVEIFKPFRRLHGRGHYEGTGIGLALCSKVAERHGGRIWVTSELGKGAQFHVTLRDAAAESIGTKEVH